MEKYEDLVRFRLLEQSKQFIRRTLAPLFIGARSGIMVKQIQYSTVGKFY
jgi:hypothetical protein